MTLVTKILNAAMASSQHVFVNYSPHVNAISVYAHRPDADYQNAHSERPRLMDETVYLDWPKADEQLATVLEMVEVLG